MAYGSAAVSWASSVQCKGLASLVLIALLLVLDSRSGSLDAAGAGLNKSQPKSCNRAAFRVVVDVGHTVEAPGALSARGVPEYEFNLRLASYIVEKLSEGGFSSSVLLITGGSAKRGLVERIARANALNADLFVSIHHDSVPEFLKEEWDYEGQKNRFSDKFKGYSIFVSHQNVKRQASFAFAKTLGRELKARGLQYTPHYKETFMGRWRRQLLDNEAGVYRFDDLTVLRTTRMPAILLEAGSIINREEELLLASTEYQSVIAAGVVSAVDQFCQPQRPSAINFQSDLGG